MGPVTYALVYKGFRDAWTHLFWAGLTWARGAGDGWRMTEKLKVGDRVRFKGWTTIRQVVEVDLPGHTPLAPSTYVVRLADPPDFKRDFYTCGDHVLERVID